MACTVYFVFHSNHHIKTRHTAVGCKHQQQQKPHKKITICQTINTTSICLTIRIKFSHRNISHNVPQCIKFTHKNTSYSCQMQKPKNTK